MATYAYVQGSLLAQSFVYQAAIRLQLGLIGSLQGTASIFHILGPAAGSLFVFDSLSGGAQAIHGLWTGENFEGEELTQVQRAGYGLLFVLEVAPGEFDNVFRSTHGQFGELARQTWRSNPGSYHSYADLRTLIRSAGLSGRSRGLEAHHLLEKRYAGLLGISQSEIISVPLTPKWHRNVGGFGDNLDNLISKELGKFGATPASATVDQVWKAHRNVYARAGYIDWAEAIYEAYFRPKGVQF